MDPAIQALIKKANKKQAGRLLLAKDANLTYDRIASGSLTLDIALGGGWPASRWNEIIGDESNGKTAIALKTVAVNQARDPNWTCLWAAAEPFVRPYAEGIGCDLSRIILIEDNSMEFVYQQVLDFAGSRAIDAVVIDSLPALVPEREDEKNVGETNPGLGALLTGQFFRKQGTAMKRSMVEEERPCTGFLINQYREKIGVMYGDPRTTPGGRAKNFFCFTRVEVRRDDWIEDAQERRVGMTVKARVIKNKTAPPQRVATFDFYFDDYDGFKLGDIDRGKEVASAALLLNVVVRKGAYYRFGSYKWHGRDQYDDALREDDELREKIAGEVFAHLGITS